MDFHLNEEQQMLKDSVRRYLADHCGFEKRHELVARGSFDAERWATMAELGWLGMALPESHGGLGGNEIDTAILMEAMGEVLFVEPFWAIAVLAGQTLAALGDDAQAKALVEQLVVGAARPVVAHGEAQARGNLSWVETTASSIGGERWRINGNKSAVVGGNVADCFLVSARTASEVSDAQGISLFVIKRDTPGLVIRDVRMIDNRWCADISLHDVVLDRAQLLGPVGGAADALQIGADHALLAACAEAVGVADRALWITRDYLKVRKQFGVTLSTFQSLQHRMSEMLIELELARCMVFQALAAMPQERQAREAALRAAKVHVGRSTRFVCAQAIQLHGGIGVTDEYVVGHHFKRITTFENLLGSSHYHLEQLAERERIVVG
ncbi:MULTISPECIES: acyl-CoA dehydrogenase family protein [Pandoraea]|uniref:Acyl-CoA dehydrogenase n=1 Tax=Pandoraea cepalis TaxID=2508294 RepID=A0AAW7MH50_9BURK|nr:MULTISPECIES: acyl-CoA dehydrogenase [Pandoraea]ALS65164.1 acyl-CoA dehydrogenase [Pandoraea apista]MDN4572079.1 acyl-CoA dehydrogenase [Pandoraea cepalis]MDN4576735.1 acyl-CoA dehydrogenase [Pandoraea cepalis]RRW92401.1 acyl-CoA dehydrogenase [Pandoraea apista]RRX01867.1 acyl-CoA dehydrogenase [Pandoraea apista]